LPLFYPQIQLTPDISKKPELLPFLGIFFPSAPWQGKYRRLKHELSRTNALHFNPFAVFCPGPERNSRHRKRPTEVSFFQRRLVMPFSL
jgi:hypothetical protein